MVEFQILNNFTKEVTVTRTECMRECSNQCTSFLQRSALNEGLWILYFSMFCISAYWFLHDNERFKGYIISRNPTAKVDVALDTLLMFGILGLVAYIAVFLIRMRMVNIG